MSTRLVIAGVTVLVFGAGYGVGVWTQRHSCKVPPPPPSLLGELSPKPAQSGAGTAGSSGGPDPSFLAQEIERLRPEIDVFRNQLYAIDREMDRKIDAMLRPEQRAAFLDLVKSGERYRAREEAERALSTPLTSDQIRDLQERPLQGLFSIVVVPMRLYWNKRQLNLDDAQAAQLEKILKWRREKFIELVDRSPPPSLQLSMLAPLAARLGEPEKKEPPQPAPTPSNQP